MGSFMHPLRHPSSAFELISTVHVILDSSHIRGDSVAIAGDAQALFLQTSLSQGGAYEYLPLSGRRLTQYNYV